MAEAIVRQAPAKRSRVRLPSGLAVCLALLLLQGAIRAAAIGDTAGLAQGFSASLSAVALVLAAGLYLHRHWARLGAAFTFAFLLLGILGRGQLADNLIEVGLLAFAGCYLLSESTAQLFRTASRSSVDSSWLLALASFALLSLGMAGLLALGLPEIWALALALIAAGANALLNPRLSPAGWLRLLWLRPADLTATEAARFRTALRCYYRGLPARARAALEGLSEAQSVTALRGLIGVAEARRGEGLERLIWDGSWHPDPEQRDTLLEGKAAGDVARLLEHRVALVDGLVEDAASTAPLFGAEAALLAEGAFGKLFVVNPGQDVRDWWRQVRPRLAGEPAWGWLTARLWHSGCWAAAAALARHGADPRLAEAAELLARLDRGAEADEGDWIVAHGAQLALIPGLAERSGMLLIGSRTTAALGPARLASRIRARVPMIERLLALWHDYDWEWFTAAGALARLLAGHASRREGLGPFLSWWDEARPRLTRFDAELATGLEWAELEEWERAGAAFAAAARADPTRLSATYDQAFCLLRCGLREEAEELLRELTRRESTEPLWWLRLGDALRLRGASTEATEAYAEAQQRLGGPSAGLSLRLAACLAREGRLEEARRTVAAVLGEEAAAEPEAAWETWLREEDERWMRARLSPQWLREARAGLEETPHPAEEDDDDT